MMGRNHLLANSALVGGGMLLLDGLRRLDDDSVKALDDHYEQMVGTWAARWGELAQLVAAGADWLHGWIWPHGYALWYVVGAVLLLWLGSLLPDIDSDTSILGRWVRLPLGPHRGITHTDWLLALLLLMALPGPTRVLFFLFLGAWLHCEVDGRSTAGRARFYPLGSWRLITLRDAPAVVLRKAPRPSYRVGGPSELVALVLCVGLGVVLGFAGRMI